VRVVAVHEREYVRGLCVHVCGVPVPVVVRVR